jgi:hypothetical protein
MDITAKSKEEYAAIENVLTAVDASGKMFSSFKSAFKDENVVDKTVVVLESNEKPSKDLNNQRYVINIPSTLTIQNIETSKYFDKAVNPSPCQPRVPNYAVKIVCSPTVDNSVVVLTYAGFNDPCIFVNVYQSV